MAWQHLVVPQRRVSRVRFVTTLWYFCDDELCCQGKLCVITVQWHRVLVRGDDVYQGTAVSAAVAVPITLYEVLTSCAHVSGSEGIVFAEVLPGLCVINDLWAFTFTMATAVVFCLPENPFLHKNILNRMNAWLSCCVYLLLTFQLSSE